MPLLAWLCLARMWGSRPRERFVVATRVLVSTYVTDEKDLWFVHHVVDSDVLLEDCRSGLMKWLSVRSCERLRGVVPLVELGRV